MQPLRHTALSGRWHAHSAERERAQAARPSADKASPCLPKLLLSHRYFAFTPYLPSPIHRVWEALDQVDVEEEKAKEEKEEDRDEDDWDPEVRALDTSQEVILERHRG